MFEYVGMPAALAARPAPSADELARLRTQIERIERTTRIGSDAPVIPAPTGIAELLPGGGLRTGMTYALGRSMPLLTALLAAPSAAGAWCAVVGMPEFGIEAAREAGVDLARLVLIPRPGERWLGVVAAVAEVVGVVAVRPGGTVRDGDAARLAARIRERETVLLAQGAWPGAEAVLDVEGMEWSGLGAGHGYLDRGTATVVVGTRRGTGPRRGRIVLASTVSPHPIGTTGATAGDPGLAGSAESGLRAVG